jgi:DNA-binding response OmpR family regulator
MMPEMDGFQFLTALRERPEWRSIPVVVLTSKDLSQEDRLRLTGNVEKILQKGAYSRDALLREVRKVVAQWTGRPPTGEPPDGKSEHGGPGEAGNGTSIAKATTGGTP